MNRTLVPFDPARELAAMSTLMDRFFGSPLAREVESMRSGQAPTLAIDVYEDAGKLWIKAAVPGVASEDLDITVQDHVLTIRGETKQNELTENGRIYRRELAYGTFTRSVRLPQNVDLEKVEADFDKGFVLVSIPIVEEPKPEALKVPINFK